MRAFVESLLLFSHNWSRVEVGHRNIGAIQSGRTYRWVIFIAIICRNLRFIGSLDLSLRIASPRINNVYCFFANRVSLALEVVELPLLSLLSCLVVWVKCLIPRPDLHCLLLRAVVSHRGWIRFVWVYLDSLLSRNVFEMNGVVFGFQFYDGLKVLLCWILVLFYFSLKFFKFWNFALLDFFFDLVHLYLKVLCFLLLKFLSREACIWVWTWASTVQNSSPTSSFLLNNIGDWPPSCVAFVILVCILIFLGDAHELSYFRMHIFMLVFVLEGLVKIVGRLASSRDHEFLSVNFH